MNSYTQNNPPKNGTARKIWAYIHRGNLRIAELHYNPNNYGNGREAGWGTWACTFERSNACPLAFSDGVHIAWINDRAIGQLMTAPYTPFDLADF